MSNYEDVIEGAQRFLQNMPDPIYIVGLDYRIVWVNAAFQALFGFDAEYLSVNGLEFYPEYTFMELEEYKNRLNNNETLLRAYSSRYCKDGTRIYLNINLTPIRNGEGAIIAYAVVLKETVSEESLKSSSEFRYRIIAENTSDTIVLVDNDAIVRYVSPSIIELSGYTINDYEGLGAFNIVHSDDRERVYESHRMSVKTGRPVDLEYRIIHKQGDIVYVEARVMPLTDKFGNMEYVVAVARDITKRKKTERLLQSILDNVNAAIWSTDKQFKRLTLCSDSIEKIFGLPRTAAEENPMRLHERLHPEDAAVLFQQVRDELKQGIPTIKSVRIIEEPHGTKWIKIIAQPILDNTGAIERIDGIFLDITDQKRSELALEESEQRYKSLFENNLDGVFSINLNGFLVNVNSSFETILGIPAERLSGRSFISLISEADSEKVHIVLSNVIEHRKPLDIECSLQDLPLGERLVSVTLVPIFRSGQLNGVHGIVKDITERKREERELIQSEEKSTFLQQSLNRLSNDLANVMKVQELEARLIHEVQHVLQVTGVSIEEIPRGQDYSSQDPRDRWIKISEKKHPVYLHFRIERTLLKIEEEWLETAIHYVTILYDNLHLIQDLMNRIEVMLSNKQTPKWMLRLLFNLSEKERSSLSGDLHDTVLQDLINWYRKLESLRSQNRLNENVTSELIRIEEGLLDAIHQIRITCNELRPPFLLKMGLVESLKSLLSYIRMFSNYEVEFSAERFEGMLDEDQVIGLYRMVQELLNNASKHSQASLVRMVLSSQSDTIHFSYSDDGVGMELASLEGSFQHMGISGIEKRVLSLDGHMEIRSSPDKGFHVNISIPKLRNLNGAE